MPQQSVEPTVQPTPQPMPQNAIVPPMQPNVSGKPSCGYTILIVIFTVICTLIAEAILIFAVATWAFKHFGDAVTNNMGFTTSDVTKTPSGATGAAALTADQKQLMTKLGIKLEDLPPDLDVQKIACVQTAIGNDRIQAIIDGKASPGFGDLFKAKSCF